MKQKILLTTCMFLTMTLTFGQHQKTRNLEKSFSPDAHKSTMEWKQNDFKIFTNAPYQNGKQLQQCAKLKSSSGIYQRLDSTIYQDWDHTAGEWTLNRKEEYVYNVNFNMIEFLQYYWNENKDVWDISSKKSYSYDSNRQLTQDINYWWDDFYEEWSEHEKKQYTYNTDGTMQQHIFFEWDKTTGHKQWVISSKDEYTYDSRGNRIEDIYYGWDVANSQWIILSAYHYEYDVKNNLTQHLFTFWDAAKSQWANRYVYYYHYDDNGNLTQQSRAIWDASNNLWVNSGGNNYYIYDDNENLTQGFSYYWDETSNQWQESPFKSDYTSDINGNPVMEVHLQFDKTTNDYFAYSKNIFSYDLTYNLSELILPEDDLFYPVSSHKIRNKPIDYISWDFDKYVTGGVLHKVNYCYSEVHTSSINETSTLSAEVYPNPFSHQLSFSFSEIYSRVTFELFDLQGCRVLKKEVRNGEVISTDGLHQGVYLYNLFIDGKKQSGKLINK